MGYTTDFTGKFEINKPLNPEHLAYLTAFSQTRRMQRNAAITATMSDPVRVAAGLPIGEQGGYFVGSTKDCGQEKTPDVTDYNNPPNGQPELWCEWIPTEDGMAIEWNGMEKFYYHVEWIQYLITHFLAPWGYVLAGSVEWQGEESVDKGRIVISNNVVRTQRGKTVYR